ETVPRFVPAYNTWLRALLLQGGLAKAQLWLSEQVGKDPENPALHHGLGVCMLLQGKRRDAIGHFDEALRIKPDLFDSLYGLHFAHYDSQEYAETLTVLERMSALVDRDDLDWQYFIAGRRGVVLKDMGSYTNAVSLLEFAAITSRDLGDLT